MGLGRLNPGCNCCNCEDFVDDISTFETVDIGSLGFDWQASNTVWNVTPEDTLKRVTNGTKAQYIARDLELPLGAPPATGQEKSLKTFDFDIKAPSGTVSIHLPYLTGTDTSTSGSQASNPDLQIDFTNGTYYLTMASPFSAGQPWSDSRSHDDIAEDTWVNIKLGVGARKTTVSGILSVTISIHINDELVLTVGGVATANSGSTPAKLFKRNGSCAWNCGGYVDDGSYVTRPIIAFPNQKYHWNGQYLYTPASGSTWIISHVNVFSGTDNGAPSFEIDNYRETSPVESDESCPEWPTYFLPEHNQIEVTITGQTWLNGTYSVRSYDPVLAVGKVSTGTKTVGSRIIKYVGDPPAPFLDTVTLDALFIGWTVSGWKARFFFNYGDVQMMEDIVSDSIPSFPHDLSQTGATIANTIKDPLQIYDPYNDLAGINLEVNGLP